MDREKAINGLEFTKAMITFNPSTGEDIEPEDLNDDNKITYDACVGAIALLKEQEPVPPDVDSEETCSCGNCGMTVGYHPVGCKTPEKLCKFCPECGRAVKWR